MRVTAIRIRPQSFRNIPHTAHPRETGEEDDQLRGSGRDLWPVKRGNREKPDLFFGHSTFAKRRDGAALCIGPARFLVRLLPGNILRILPLPQTMFLSQIAQEGTISTQALFTNQRSCPSFTAFKSKVASTR
ncbi:hypothetical protein TNIN_167211 [Trichonephila inaurata madagascariensis]|uniref:Uncharacterized protein n=1 Tax=Trichonephila inaurata madagascariensis TaxID=2747483 RepID=A0A8X7C605_9ARAC|nr:hypothetical protein TNIN_167211 [Trichonephila inaurata madagascariensis]